MVGSEVATAIAQRFALPASPAIVVAIKEGPDASDRLKPGTRLHGIHRGIRHEVRLDDGGSRLWLDDDAYDSPNAGKTATGRKTCAGWKFWHIDLAGGTAVPLGGFRDNPSLIV
jgi:hypothetical protein